ncbi:Hydroxybutyrate dehydrogenase [Operophtera brumata]|uniref:Hydroxybutyrate dehydrogenase n=1 Tax=Operophtera brumata TaxID=104452 RepID=A0A0L7LH86_OPEBR|nr:Hydroxybutyrate dehydrogenase [Operophtera brumata]
MSFQNKVVLVTGASSGIGAATAIAFAAEGARVAIVGRNEKKLAVTAEQCEKKGSKPLFIAADVTKDEDVIRIMKDTINHFGKLDVLVNNAGIAPNASILAPDAMDTFDKTMTTNLRSVVHLTHLAAPYLVESKGNIVNVSSIAALSVVVNYSSAYSTSKAGLDHFTRCVALELAAKGVRVNTVNPGPVKTDILESAGVTAEQRDAMMAAVSKMVPLGRVGEPEEIADVILFLASDKAKSVTGSTYVSDNGMVMNGIMQIPE